MVTTIQIDEKLKSRLDQLKIHHRESYNELIQRIIDNNSKEDDRENLLETIEILSNPQEMRDIAESLESINKGEFGTPIEEVRKELGL
jgi:predicted transcriptional regulator